MPNLNRFVPCSTPSSSSWQQYSTDLSNAPGTVKIGLKEWRDGFGAVFSDDGTNYRLTGRRVDDNGLTKLHGGAVKSGYSMDKHNELYHVFRSMENQTHLSATTSVSDSAPSDATWYNWGFTTQTWTDPGASFDSNNELNVYKVEAEVNHNYAYFIISVRGDAKAEQFVANTNTWSERSEGWIEYRRKGATTWTRGPQYRVVHPNSTDAHINLGRHLSGPIFRLAPATTYECRINIHSPDYGAAFGSSTSYSTSVITSNIFEFNTRHQPYATGDHATYNWSNPLTISNRSDLFTELETSSTIAGGVIKISAGDYTDTNAKTTKLNINVGGTQAKPLIIMGDGGQVILPAIIVNTSWVIIHGVKIADLAGHEGNYTSTGVSTAIKINQSEQEGVVLSDVDLHWHSTMPTTWEEGYLSTPSLSYDLARTKVGGVPAGTSKSDPSPKYTVIENCHLQDGPPVTLQEIVDGDKRMFEWISNNGFEVRHQQFLIRNCNLFNQYENGFNGWSSAPGLSVRSCMQNNFFFGHLDDVVEFEYSQGGHIMMDNRIAGSMWTHAPQIGAAPIAPTNTGKTRTETILSATEVSTGRWEVEFSGGNSTPTSQGASLWQDGKCWWSDYSVSVKGNYPGSTTKLVFTTDIGKAFPGWTAGASQIYATDSDSITTGTCVISYAGRQPFVGSNTISLQNTETGTLQNWIVNSQHTGATDACNCKDVPYKWKKERPGNFVGCFQTTSRGCEHVFNPARGGGYYFANNTWALVQNSWQISQANTSTNEKLGDWYSASDVNGDPVPQNVWPLGDYNAYYNNNSSKYYWAGKQLSSIQSDYTPKATTSPANWGTTMDANSHDYASVNTQDNVLNVSYDNMFDEPSKSNRNSPGNAYYDLQNPEWTYTSSDSRYNATSSGDFGGYAGPAAIGAIKPLRAKSASTSLSYGTGVPTSNPIAHVIGPTILSTDDVTFLGGVNKTEDRTDVAPHQACLGDSKAGKNTMKNYEQYSVPDGWHEHSLTDTSLMSTLGINPGTGTIKAFIVKDDNSVGLLVEK